MFAGADDDDEEEDSNLVKAGPAKLPEPPAKLLETKSAPVQPTFKPSPPAPAKEESAAVADFKNSLSSLLSKGNPLMPGVARKAPTQQKKPEVEEEQKEKIKFDIYNNDEEAESPDYKTKTVLDNVSTIHD